MTFIPVRVLKCCERIRDKRTYYSYEEDVWTFYPYTQNQIVMKSFFGKTTVYYDEGIRIKFCPFCGTKTPKHEYPKFDLCDYCKKRRRRRKVIEI